MSTLSSISFLVGVILLAVCLTEIMDGIADDSEKRRQKRREQYRRTAYADVYRRRIMSSNRDALWKAVSK
jgi:hypothetical protein